MSSPRSSIALVLGLLLLVGSGPAAAEGDGQPREVERLELEQSVAVEDDTHQFNSNAFDQHKIVTFGDHQYTLYWAGDRHLKLARRDLRTDDVDTLELPDTISRPNDPHNNTVVGVSGDDGRLHLSYDHHGAQLRYRYSRAGFLTDPPEQMTLADFSPRSPLVPDEPELEERVTYPRFFNHPDGTLYFEYRNGGSGNGDRLLHRHDAATNTWERLGALLQRSGTYPEWNDSTSRNAYPHDYVFGEDGRLHVTWTWRETPAWPSNHGVNYAYSDDGGVTWHNNAGAHVADLSADDPIQLADDTEVVEAPVNSWFMNTGAMTLDLDGQPHIITYRSTKVSEDPSARDLHYIHYWRTSDGRWHERFVDDTSVDPEPWAARPHPEPLRRGDLFFDDAGNLHAYFPVAGRIYAGVARAHTGWADWRIYKIGDGPLPPLEHGPKHDRARWERDGVISMAHSEVTEDGYRFVIEDYLLGAGSAPEPPDLELAREAPTSAQGEPAIHVLWNGAIGAESYHVWRRGEGETSFTLLAEHFSERSVQRGYVDTDVEPGRDYTYRIAADNLFGTSEAAEITGQVLVNHALHANITASSSQDDFPPSLAVDGDESTFWVSREPATEDAPEWLEVDLGQERTVSRLAMLPRPSRFGPRDIVWQVPDGAGGWRDVATAVADRSGRTEVTIDPLTTRRVRLVMTSGYDDRGPDGGNRNVQVAEMEVYNR